MVGGSYGPGGDSGVSGGGSGGAGGGSGVGGGGAPKGLILSMDSKRLVIQAQDLQDRSWTSRSISSTSRKISRTTFAEALIVLNVFYWAS